MEPFVWLFRDSTEIDRRIFAEFALENRLADALLIAIEGGLRVWSARARELASAWPAAAGLTFSDPPDGSLPDAGWSVSWSGVTSTLKVGGSGGARYDARDPTALWASLPMAMDRVSDGEFRGCSALSFIWIPSSVQVFGGHAFSGCCALRQVVIPDGVIRICDGAFSFCVALRRLVIPASVKEIGCGAFECCSGLEHLVFCPGDLKGRLPVTEQPKWRCPTDEEVASSHQLTIEVMLRGTVDETAGLAAVRDALIHPAGRDECPFSRGSPSTGARSRHADRNAGLRRFAPKGQREESPATGEGSVVSESRKMTIGVRAFALCSRLREIVIPERVAEIAKEAFEGCTALECVTVSQLTKVDASSFACCPHLELMIAGDARATRRRDGAARPRTRKEIGVIVSPGWGRDEAAVRGDGCVERLFVV
jgi:hypothetical protein